MTADKYIPADKVAKVRDKVDDWISNEATKRTRGEILNDLIRLVRHATPAPSPTGIDPAKVTDALRLHLYDDPKYLTVGYWIRKSKNMAHFGARLDALITAAEEQEPTVPVSADVQRFADAMEAELKRNDHKTGWNDEEVEWLLSQAGDNLQHAVRSSDAETFTKSIVDAANYLMMAYDNYTRDNLAPHRRAAAPEPNILASGQSETPDPDAPPSTEDELLQLNRDGERYRYVIVDIANGNTFLCKDMPESVTVQNRADYIDHCAKPPENADHTKHYTLADRQIAMEFCAKICRGEHGAAVRAFVAERPAPTEGVQDDS